MLYVGCGECIEADLRDGSCPEEGLALMLMDKEGVFFFIFKPANEGGRGFDIGGLIEDRGSPVFGLVGANAPIPSLCFIDIPPPPEVNSERCWAWGSGCCEKISVDGTLAAVLAFVVGTTDGRLLIRGISGDDGAENKDVREFAREGASFTRLLLTGLSWRVNIAPLP